MAVPNTSLTKQQLVNALKTLRNTYTSEHEKLDGKLAADTTDPIDPYSHHAYRMIDYGENKQLKETLEKLNELIVTYDETTRAIVFDLNNCTGTQPTLDPQVVGSKVTLPAISGLTPPDVPDSDKIDGVAQKGYKIYGWCTVKKTPGDNSAHGTVYKPGTVIDMPAGTSALTLYVFYEYDPNFVPPTTTT